MVSATPHSIGSTLLDSVDELLFEAGVIALADFRQPVPIENKMDVGFDPVTRADRGVEQFLRRGLSELRPDDRVVGEEAGASGSGRSGWTWTIDPIDGTRSFVTGSPLWGVLLGLQVDDQPVAGWLYQPHTGELFRAADGKGAYTRDGERRELLASATTALNAASLYCTDPAYFQVPEDRAAFDRLTRSVRLRRLGGDCYSYGLLALGGVELVVDGSLQPYDILPLIPIVEAAGGVVTTFDGDPARMGGSVIAAANPEIHRAALAVLGRTPS